MDPQKNHMDNRTNQMMVRIKVFIGLPDFMLSVVLQFQNGKNLFNFVFMSTHMCV